ncbi:MAG: hypothetical protein V3U76_05855 [Granulosicoccus sp.]
MAGAECADGLKISLTHKAKDYTLKQWSKLIRYGETGHLPNNNILA